MGCQFADQQGLTVDALSAACVLVVMLTRSLLGIALILDTRVRLHNFG